MITILVFYFTQALAYNNSSYTLGPNIITNPYFDDNFLNGAAAMNTADLPGWTPDPLC
jgi:hypothetical protein